MGDIASQPTMLGAIFAVIIGIATIFGFYVYWVRRKSLHQREDGTYVWRDWHGGECTSIEDPSALGGEWDSGSDGDGGGDGGGGD